MQAAGGGMGIDLLCDLFHTSFCMSQGNEGPCEKGFLNSRASVYFVPHGAVN